MVSVLVAAAVRRQHQRHMCTNGRKTRRIKLAKAMETREGETFCFHLDVRADCEWMGRSVE